MNPPVDPVLRPDGDASLARQLILANVSRRQFLRGMSLGGLVLALGYPSSAKAEEAQKYGADGMPDGWVDDPLAFVRNRELFGDLGDNPRFAATYQRYLGALHDKGAVATLKLVSG